MEIKGVTFDAREVILLLLQARLLVDRAERRVGWLRLTEAEYADIYAMRVGLERRLSALKVTQLDSGPEACGPQCRPSTVQDGGPFVKAETFENWKAIGYRVRKGERATGRCPKTGKATFTRDQVDEDESFDCRTQHHHEDNDA